MNKELLSCFEMNDGKRLRDGWGSPLNPPTLERGNELLRVETAVRQYLNRGKHPNEKLAIKIVSEVLALFLTDPKGAEPGRLQRALDTLRLGGENIESRRTWCVRTVRELGAAYLQAESVEERDFYAERLAIRLGIYDQGFENLVDDLATLKEKLTSFSLSPSKSGGKGAERILAELIVEDRDALDLSPRTDEPEAIAVERIRKVLSRDVDSYLRKNLAAK